jgi:hypothetical protein
MRLTLFAILTFSVLYWFPIRRWMSRWGATPSDLTRVMAGDALLVNPTYSGTMAVITTRRQKTPVKQEYVRRGPLGHRAAEAKNRTSQKRSRSRPTDE